jgi:hypothetical protein
MDDDRAPGSGDQPNFDCKTHRKKTKKYPDGMTQRSIVEMHPGRHRGIVPLGLWQANQQERKNCGSTPRPNGRPLHEYLLSGVGYCWECHAWDGRQASLRGITGNGYQYYRCSTMQGEYKIRHKPHPHNFTAALTSLQMDAVEQENRQSLISLHRSTFPKKTVEEQVSQFIDQLVIPVDWYDLILAYYLNDKGMSEFELEGYNLRQELTRQRELFKRGHITQAEYEQAYLFIDRQLQRLKPSAYPEAKRIIPLLGNFSTLWQQMTLTERRAILQAMFAGLYFDAQNHLQKIAAHDPFDKLMNLEKDELEYILPE